MDLFSSKIDNGPRSEPSLALARFRSNSYQLNKNGLSCLKKAPLSQKKRFGKKFLANIFERRIIHMGTKDVYNVPPVLPNKLQKRLTSNVGALKTQRKLTTREWSFVKELVSNDGQITMKEAALRAGYSPKSAKVIAWKLTNPEICPHVVAAIQSYRAELAQKYGTNFDRHMKDLQKIRDAALEAGAFGAAVQAEYRRGQALGTIYVDKKEVRYGTIDGMSKDEVVRKLEEIKKVYGPAPKEILDVEVKDVSRETSVKPKEKKTFAANAT